jgi:hypothetical protein
VTEQPQRVVRHIVEAHLEGATLALERFEAGLSSATLTLDALAKGPESAFLANVDGLLAGGEPVVDQVLLPAFAAKKPPPSHRAAAIVVALLQAGRAPLAIRALTHEAPSARRGALRGCLLGAGSRLDAWIAQSLANPRSAVARPVLLDLAAERGIVVDSLLASFRSDDPDELMAALRVACRVPPAPLEAHVAALLKHAHPGVRDAAMLAALHHGSFEGWAFCQRLAFDSLAPHPLAMALVAGLGEPGHHKRLAALVDSEAHRPTALRALGFSGNVGLVPQLLEHVRSGEKAAAPAAREALATMLGAEVDRWASGPEDMFDHAAWWQGARGRFGEGRRYLAGLPATRAAFAQALTHFPTRRRYLLSLLLSIRTGGASRVSTRASTETQRAQLVGLRSMGPEAPWAREFSVF